MFGSEYKSLPSVYVNWQNSRKKWNEKEFNTGTYNERVKKAEQFINYQGSLGNEASINWTKSQ